MIDHVPDDYKRLICLDDIYNIDADGQKIKDALVEIADVFGPEVTFLSAGRVQFTNDVSEMARAAKSRAANAYQTLNEELGPPAEPVSPSLFVPRLASDLKCPDTIRQRARALAEQAEERGVTTGVHPAGFAAACLYKAGREE